MLIKRENPLQCKSCLIKSSAGLCPYCTADLTSIQSLGIRIAVTVMGYIVLESWGGVSK